MPEKTTPAAFGDMSFAERRSHLQTALDAWTEEQNDAVDQDYWYRHRYIVDVYDDYLIFEQYGTEGTACYRADYTIGDDYVVTFQNPVKVIRTSNYEPAPDTIAEGPGEEDAAMSMEAAANADIVTAPALRLTGRATFADGFIVRTGKVSEAGAYPDKQIDFAPEDFDKAASAFQPVNLNNEHKPSLMDGALGTLRKVWRDGNSLFGEVAVPKWLDDVFNANGVARTVSLEWNRTTKAITGCAWAKHPRITDAALMSAFSASKEKSGIAENTAALKGAQDPARSAPDTTRRGSPLQKGTTLMLFTAAEKKVADLLKKQGKSDDEINAEVAAIFADDREASIATDAATFADQMIREERAKPAAKPIIASFYAQALRDDRANDGKVTFSKEENSTTTGSRVDMVKALFAAIEPDMLTREVVDTNTDVTVRMNPQQTKTQDGKTVNGKGTAKMSDDRKNELIGMTPLGKSVLSEKAAMNGAGD